MGSVGATLGGCPPEVRSIKLGVRGLRAAQAAGFLDFVAAKAWVVGGGRSGAHMGVALDPRGHHDRSEVSVAAPENQLRHSHASEHRIFATLCYIGAHEPNSINGVSPLICVASGDWLKNPYV